MTYIDGFVAAAPSGKQEEYRAYSEKMSRFFKKHGATRVTECWGDDVPDGKLTSFPMAVKKEADETVVFSWIEWPSKQVRDEAWGKMMAEMEEQSKDNPMPFDGKRMIYGGFSMILDV